MDVETWRARKQFVTVHGRRMAYVEMGQGRPIVFQHGNPTSSYLWRNILPHLASFGRCIALDLIGMGDSDKLPDSDITRYRFIEHRHYWDAALVALGVVADVRFVLHDWGTALGFDWCRRHPQAVSAVCHMEGLVLPLTWEDWPADAVEIFRMFRSPAGEGAVLDQNLFLEAVFPAAILRQLTDEEMAAYRAPFLEAGEARRPMLTWPRQLPLDGEPAEVCELVERYGAFMQSAPFPKLMIAGDPGMIMNGRAGEFARSWANQREVSVKGLHFLQEDSPQAIADAIAAWFRTVEP
mgnify:CR=1 FL=1